MNIEVYSCNGQSYSKTQFLDVKEEHVKDLLKRVEDIDAQINFEEFKMRLNFRYQTVDLWVFNGKLSLPNYLGLKVTPRSALIHTRLSQITSHPRDLFRIKLKS